MRRRPLSVSIISWIFIVLAVLGLGGILVFMNVPEVRETVEKGRLSPEMQLAWSIAGLAVLAVSGIGMLSGRNWARLLYVIWTVFSIIAGLFTAPSPAAMIPSLVAFLVFAYFLFCPAANDYFRGLPPVPDNANP